MFSFFPVIEITIIIPTIFVYFKDIYISIPDLLPGHLDHYKALLVLLGGRLLRLHHEGVHPATDVSGGQAYLESGNMFRISVKGIFQLVDCCC